MFDLAWSELALIAVVAVVVIGPKDLPDAVRGVARGIQKLRRMAGEFQGQLDEVVREAKLEDVRDQIRDIRNFDLKSTLEKHVDADGSITRTFRDDPFRDDPFRAAPPPTSDAAPAAGTEAVLPGDLPGGPPPVDATAPAPGVVAAQAAADTPDATPAAASPAATPAAAAPQGPAPAEAPSATPPPSAAAAAPAVHSAEASGLSPFPEPAPAAPPHPPEAIPADGTPPRPATHTA